MADDALVPARTIGRYQVVAELGRGAMGVVYLAFDPVIGRQVALKTILVGAVAEDAEEFRQRLFREAAAAGALTHPNIVTIHDVVHEAGTTAVAMEFVEGETLAALIARRAPLPLDEAVSIFAQVATGLDYAALRGIVHRDIKPANILIGADGRPRIADFGIARLPQSNLTMSGAVLGSAGYMSPEQVRGLPLDARSDLFSAATVLYEMLTGTNPFGGTEAANTLYRIVNEEPPPIRLANPAVPRAVEAVVARALAKDPAARFATGADLARALGAAAEGVRISGPRSGRTALVGVGVAGLIGAVSLGAFLWSQSTPSADAPPASSAATTPELPAGPVVTPAAVPATTPQRAPARQTPVRSTPRAATPAPGASAEPPPVVTKPPASVAAPAPAPAPTPGVLSVMFQGSAFPVVIYAGEQQVGQLDGPGEVSLASGTHQVRVVAGAVFFSKVYEAMTVAPGGAATLVVPPLGSAVAAVKGEAYSGVRIAVDDRALPVPYPAQLPRIGPGMHTVTYSWIAGTRAGQVLTQSFEVSSGGLVRVVADAENNRVDVLKIR